MTVSFLEMLGGENSPTFQDDSSAVGICPQAPTADVSESRHSHKLTDSEREAAIALATSLICHHMDLYEISGCFTDRANADRARLSMEALIKGRSEAAKAKAGCAQ